MVVKKRRKDNEQIALVSKININPHIDDNRFGCTPHILKEDPPSGSLPYGEVVFVDDGVCPPDEINKITGGSNRMNIPRRTECVKCPK